jgi:universal stress protein A
MLVPVDLTQKNAHAVATARDLAAESGGTVTLLHVIETLDLPFEELEAFYARLEEKARRAMEEMAEPLQEAGLSFARRVSYGRRAEEIVDFAAEEDSDLIILSSHRIDLEKPGSSWTTLSYKVAILAQCPVLLVK